MEKISILICAIISALGFIITMEGYMLNGILVFGLGGILLIILGLMEDRGK